MHPNDPANDSCAGQLDAELHLIATYFDGLPDFCETKCVQFCQLSETCLALDEAEPDRCPKLQSLIDEELQAMADEHCGTR